MKRTLSLLSLFTLLAATAARADVTVTAPWVRATVPHQHASGAFMKLESPRDVRLVSASSPVAGSVELHEMKMEHDVMKMRAVRSIPVPGGKGAELKPGGYHLMLLDLKSQLKAGDSVPITLITEGKDGKRESVTVQAPVRPLNSGAQAHGGGMPMHMNPEPARDR